MFGKKLVTVIVCLNLITCLAFAKKSVFIISSHNQSHAQAYSIDGNQVTYQADVNIYTPPKSDIGTPGPVGNAVWPEKNLMFTTYEFSPVIAWSSTKTLEYVGQFDTEIYYNNERGLAGIVVNKSRALIYVITREAGDLYAYSFDDTNNTLINKGMWHLNPTDGYYISGLGLALDESENLLYAASDGSSRVHIYDVNDFNSSKSSVNPKSFIDIDVNAEPMQASAVAVDPVRRFMYTGAFIETNGYHHYLVRTMLDAPHESNDIPIENEGNSGTATGLDVDIDTGLIYCTTSLNDFRVYDSNFNLKDTKTNNISGPAGVAVGGWFKLPYFIISKDNNNPDNNCVDPNVHKNITFDIRWDLNGHSDTNIKVIDYLPKALDYNSSSGDYNSFYKTVTWNASGSSGHIVLTANINRWAAPGDTITNIARIEGDTYLTETTCDVNVCNWDGSIIYVDKDANGFNNGTNWNDAYTDLQVAVNKALELSPAITAIWVAAGTYKPVNDVNIDGYQNANFALPGNVALIGHFGGVGTYETSPYQRNLADTNKETILDGQIGSYTSQAVNHIIIAQDISSGLIDGFTIKGSSKNSDKSSAIYLNDANNVTIVNCKIIDNQYNGIYAENASDSDVHNCLFTNNSNSSIYSNKSVVDINYCTLDGSGSGSYGLYLENNAATTVENSEFKNNSSYAIYGDNITINIKRTLIENNPEIGLYLKNNSNLDMENSIVRTSGYGGIYLSQNNSTKIINNWIHNNYAYGASYDHSGIYFESQNMVPIIRNNTIYGNYPYGIECSQSGQEPDPCIINCIIYGNDTNDLHKSTGSFNRVSYCLLQHPLGSINKTGDPCFTHRSTDPNDFHIDMNSICKNAGNPNISYDDETDIDGEPRVSYGRVDIGGDEYYWSKADYNKDGIVDSCDFAKFAKQWMLQDVNISLDSNNVVDIYDLALFCDEWLWKAGWKQGLWMATDNGMFAEMEGMDSYEMGIAQSQTGDALMLPDAGSSFAAGSARLQANVRRFYDIPQNPTSSVSLGDMNTNADETATPSELSNDMSTMVTVEVPVENQQQSVLAGVGQTAGIWLVYDGNMTPDYNDEITVYVHSDPLLFAMDTIIEISGDANITTAMSESDCNNFGWDNGWNSDPYIDPEGWLLIDGVSWESTVSGTIGYFKFRYYSGEVTVSITEDSCAFDANCEPVLFSGQPLIFGLDPNE